MASATTLAAPAAGHTTISELRASLARFSVEIDTADTEIAAAQARAAELRAAQEKVERELERVVLSALGWAAKRGNQ